jgi:hypothetical protein
MLEGASEAPSISVSLSLQLTRAFESSSGGAALARCFHGGYFFSATLKPVPLMTSRSFSSVTFASSYWMTASPFS